MTCTSPKLRVLERTSWVAQHFCKTFFTSQAPPNGWHNILHVAGPAKGWRNILHVASPAKWVAQHFSRRKPRQMDGTTFCMSQVPQKEWRNILHVACPARACKRCPRAPSGGQSVFKSQVSRQHLNNAQSFPCSKSEFTRRV